MEKQNIKIILGTFICSLSICIVINVIVNPYGLYGQTTIGEPVTHNDRISKTQYFIKKKLNSEILIFGSSNSMRFYPEWYEDYFGSKTFNFAFFQASVEDFYCTLRFVLDKNPKDLKLVIFNLDDWNFSEIKENSFNILHPANNRLSSVPYLAKYLYNYIEFLYPLSRYKTAISFDQFKCSLESLLAYGFEKNTININNVFYENGVRIKYMDREGNNITQIAEEGKYDITNYLKTSREKIKSFPGHDKLESQEFFEEISESRKKYFEDLIIHLKLKNIKVIINVMPIQPYEQNYVCEETNYIDRMQEMMNWLNSLKTNNKNIILVKDNSKIVNFGGLGNHFLDALHQTSVNRKKMFNSIIKELPKDVI